MGSKEFHGNGVVFHGLHETLGVCVGDDEPDGAQGEMRSDRSLGGSEV